MFETLELKIENRVAWLTLNRPEKLNAINPQMMKELVGAFTELGDNRDACCVVLRGAGRAFCAGMDLKWSEELTRADRVEQGRMGQRMVDAVERTPIPVVAAIHGHALGGGLELALGADFIVCSENANLGLVEITLSAQPPYRPKMTEDGDPDQPEFGGNAPGWGGLRRLPARVGKARAKELILTGARIDGGRAAEIGLANHCWSADAYEGELKELATRLAAMNRYNLRLIKELVDAGYDWIEPHSS
jgi:enoyl-CoA hydratase